MREPSAFLLCPSATNPNPIIVTPSRSKGKPVEIYQYLEPLLNDYRKIRVKGHESQFEISHVDELVDKFLTEVVIIISP